MENNYSIEEILSAVEDLQKIKKVKNEKILNTPQNKINYSEIPKSTLSLIEEAEKSKN
tara:strand:- start:540 stop:713 length:174 start_codon:yes stop_codon:yes gene_type:complete